MGQRYGEQIFIHETFFKVFATHKMWSKCGVNCTM